MAGVARIPRLAATLALGALAAVGIPDVGVAGTAHAAQPAPAYAFITNQGSHDLSQVDLTTGREVVRVPLPKGPAGIAVDDRTGQLFATSPDAATVTRLSATDFLRRDELQVGGGPVGVAVAPDGQRVYVSDWFGNQLLVIDAQAFQVLQRLPLGRVPAGVVVAPDSRTVYVAERDEDRVAVIDTGTSPARVRAVIPVGQHPFGLALDPSGRQLAVVNVVSNSVSVIDIQRGVVAQTIAVGHTPYCAAWAPDGLLWVTNQHGDSVSVVDVAHDHAIATVPTDGFPEGIAIEGDRVLVVSWMDEVLDILDRTSYKVLRRVPLGHNSRGFGAFVWHPPAERVRPASNP